MMNQSRVIVKLRKKGVVILPKRVREEAGLRENDYLLVTVRKGVVELKRYRPLVVDVPPSLVDEALGEEKRLEEEKARRILREQEDSP